MFLMLYPKMLVGWDCGMSTEEEVVEYVGIFKKWNSSSQQLEVMCGYC